MKADDALTNLLEAELSDYMDDEPGWAHQAARQAVGAIREAGWIPVNKPTRQAPRNFTLFRDLDVSGVSGTGTVAWGVEFPDGTVVVRWCASESDHSTVVWDSIESVERIHGHGGATRIIWYN